MIDLLLKNASRSGVEIDKLFDLITFLVGFWFLLAEAVLFGLVFRFHRSRSPRALYVSGEEKHQKRWIAVPHVLVLLCDVVIIAGTMLVWSHVKQQLPPADAVVRIGSQQWAWVFTLPGPDGVFDTPDDIARVNELHVRSGAVYHFELTAQDVIHCFSVPAFRLKQDAVPGRLIKGWFAALEPGRYDIQCAEMCGIGHGLMAASLYVEEKEQHARWLQENAAPPRELVAFRFPNP